MYPHNVFSQSWGQEEVSAAAYKPCQGEVGSCPEHLMVRIGNAHRGQHYSRQEIAQTIEAVNYKNIN